MNNNAILNNYVIFFDNYTFHNNNIIYNTLKRWLIYDIINMKYNLKILNDIILIKTCPNFIETKLNVLNDYNDILNIISNINNILYKKYTICDFSNIKLILEKIIEYEKDNLNYPCKYLIITSINNLNYYNDEIIKNYFDKINNQIDIINISNYPFLNKISDKINEYFIDRKKIKIESIINDKIFNTKFNIDDIKLINNYNLEQINIDDMYNIISYFNLLHKIEIMIYNNINNNIIDDDILSNFAKYLRIKCYSKNNQDNLINIIKCYQNNIRNIINSLFKKIFILPINKLNEQLSNSYFKYILEFYELIYPLIFKNYIDKNIKGYKINNNMTSEIIFNKFNLINLIDIVDDSLEFTNSSLSLTNWVEEYNNFNPVGILIKYDVHKYSYKGLIDSYSTIVNTYPNMVINSVINNWTSIYDYYQIILLDIDPNNNVDDQTKNTEIFNINDFIITDNLFGNTNVLLPMYINKNHWNLVKSLWKYHITFINNSFEFEYVKKMDNIYYLVLLKNYNTIINDPKNISNQNLRLFIYILRTCLQLSLDNKYIFSIKDDYKRYFDIIIKNNFNKNNSNIIDWIIRIIQLIISGNCEINILVNDLKFMRNNLFNEYIINNYKIDFWEMINDPNILIEKKKEEILLLKTECVQSNINWLNLEIDLTNICNFINQIYKIKGFNKFIKIVDNVNGCIPIKSNIFNVNDNEICCDVLKNILTNIITNNIIDISNYPVDISKYTSEMF